MSVAPGFARNSAVLRNGSPEVPGAGPGRSPFGLIESQIERLDERQGARSGLQTRPSTNSPGWAGRGAGKCARLNRRYLAEARSASTRGARLLRPRPTAGPALPAFAPPSASAAGPPPPPPARLQIRPTSRSTAARQRGRRGCFLLRGLSQIDLDLGEPAIVDEEPRNEADAKIIAAMNSAVRRIAELKELEKRMLRRAPTAGPRVSGLTIEHFSGAGNRPRAIAVRVDAVLAAPAHRGAAVLSSDPTVHSLNSSLSLSERRRCDGRLIRMGRDFRLWGSCDFCVLCGSERLHRFWPRGRPGEEHCLRRTPRTNSRRGLPVRSTRADRNLTPRKTGSGPRICRAFRRFRG